MDSRISVNEAEIVGARCPRAAVTRRGDTTLRHMDHPRALHGCDFRAAISRIVIRYDHFNLITSAGIIRARYFDRIKQSRQIMFFVVGGNDYGESHICSMSLPNSVRLLLWIKSNTPKPSAG